MTPGALAALIDSALSQLPTAALPKRIVLGYSGGLDSEVLACALGQFKQAPNSAAIECMLVHVHHGLSANADAWAAHCRERAAIYGLPLVVERVSVKQGPRLSLEAEARNARYRALCAHLQAGDVLLTAHHQDDQLETVLLALTRGLGPKGLAAMGVCQPLRLDSANEAEAATNEQGADDAKGWARCAFQLRPFLHLSRDELKQASDSLGLVHINDDSNADTRFDRNYLRLEVIPKLTARWGAIAATASRSARLCAESQSLLDDEARQRLAPLLDTCPYSVQPRLKLGPLAAMSKPWQAQLIRHFLLENRLAPPSEVQLDEALSQLLAARADASVEMQFGATRLRRFQDWLYADTVSPERSGNAKPNTSLGANSATTLAELKAGFDTPLGQVRLLPAEGAQFAIAATALEGQLSLGYGLPGSLKARPAGRVHSRELKKLWQEQGVPSWLRATIPMLMCDGKLVAALGVWIEADACARAGEPGFCVQLSRCP